MNTVVHCILIKSAQCQLPDKTVTPGLAIPCLLTVPQNSGIMMPQPVAINFDSKS